MPEPKIKIEEIEVGPFRRFQLPGRESSTLRILVTSAFDPDLQRGDCLTAAREVGDLLRNLPFHVQADIFPRTTCRAFPDKLQGAEFAAWVHLCHGKKGWGFLEGSSEKLASAKRWLECFQAYQGSLPLVFFSACESSDVAELFAQAGAGVAIGFENEVLGIAPRILTGPVVRATLLNRGDRTSITSAFVAACDQLAARTYSSGGKDQSFLDGGPVAFVSKQ